MRWCGRSVAAAAVVNGLASGFVFSYFERSALCGGGDGGWRSRLAVAGVASGARLAHANPVLRHLGLWAWVVFSAENTAIKTRASEMLAPPEALPPWAARGAPGAWTRQAGAALLYGALHSALRRPGEAATGEAAAIPRARPPALLLTRIRARMLAYLSSPSGPLTVRNTESEFFYFAKNYGLGRGGGPIHGKQ